MRKWIGEGPDIPLDRVQDMYWWRWGQLKPHTHNHYTVCTCVCVCVCTLGVTARDSAGEAHLEDGVHGAREWSVMGVQSHAEDVQPPLVDVLQVLFERRVRLGSVKNRP